MVFGGEIAYCFIWNVAILNGKDMSRRCFPQKCNKILTSNTQTQGSTSHHSSPCLKTTHMTKLNMDIDIDIDMDCLAEL